jgi:serine phosphatase RsbU (regulator of sigma subunit)
MFVTFFCGILNIPTGQVHYSNAGHNLPFYLSRDGVSPSKTPAEYPWGLWSKAHMHQAGSFSVPAKVCCFTPTG